MLASNRPITHFRTSAFHFCLLLSSTRAGRAGEADARLGGRLFALALSELSLALGADAEHAEGVVRRGEAVPGGDGVLKCL